MTPIWGNGGHQTKFDEDTIRHSERGVRKMFPTVAETLGEVCNCGRELCWRQLGLKPRKPYLLHVLWSIRILFEQTSYEVVYLLQASIQIWGCISSLGQHSDIWDCISSSGHHSDIWGCPHISEYWPEDGLIRPKLAATIKYLYTIVVFWR